MDIMTADVDGCETMRTIRLDLHDRSLPIVALTAQATNGDREKRLQAGASENIATPVYTERVLSPLRVWPYH